MLRVLLRDVLWLVGVVPFYVGLVALPFEIGADPTAGSR